MSTPTFTATAPENGPEQDEARQSLEDTGRSDADTSSTDDESGDDESGDDLLKQINKRNREAANLRARLKAQTDEFEAFKAQAARDAADAAELRRLADASKTEAEREAERQQARFTALEAKVRESEERQAAAERKAAVAEIKAEYQISDADAALYLSDPTADLDRLRDIAADLRDKARAARRNGNTVPSEGRRTPAPPSDPWAQTARSLFGNPQ